MAFRKITRFTTRIFIFITLILVAVMFTELTVLNERQNPWKQSFFTIFAEWVSDPNSIDVVALKSRHASYMEDGIIIPKSTTSDVNASTGFPVRTAKLSSDVSSEQFSAIEPAAGMDSLVTFSLSDSDDPSVGLSALGLEEEDISDIFSKRNVEDVILSRGEVPEYAFKPRITPKAIVIDSQITQNNKSKTEVASTTDKTYEIYTHAPVEVEEDHSSAGGQDEGSYQYKRPEQKGQIAIIIDDMGISLRSKLVEVLPGPLTLSYLPYAENLKERAKRARTNGHELMVHIPMEPLNGNLDGGPRVLKGSHSKEELLDTLNWGLSQFDGYVGINNHMGSKITADKDAMDRIMAELKTRDLFFVDSRTISSSVAADSARDAGIAYAVRDVFLDHEVSADFIQEALTKVEQKAATRGYAIAIGHPHKETITALKEWIPSLEEKGLALVPVSALLNHPVTEASQASLN